MAGEQADLMSLGKHCDIPDCHQLDFLPFTCDKCKGVFCVRHRREQDHKCINPNTGDITVPTCPLCGQLVKIGYGMSINDQVEKHITSGCKEFLFIPMKRSARSNSCAFKGCKRHELVPLVCQNCGMNYCIRHRHSIDHCCQMHQSRTIPVH